MTSITTNLIKQNNKRQKTDFKDKSDCNFHRNSYKEEYCFDDTSVTYFEINLSLEFQMAYKSSNISFFV